MNVSELRPGDIELLKKKSHSQTSAKQRDRYRAVMLALMHRLGLSCLKPRPKHRKNDPEKMEQWLDNAPFLSKPSETNTPTKKSRSGSWMKPGSASKGH